MDRYTIVVVIGCQRSGTTLIGQILGAHTDAILIDEGEGAMQLLHDMDGRPRDLQETFVRCLRKARSKYHDARRFGPDGYPAPGITHIVLKAPNATYFRQTLRESRHVLRYVVAVRDARDVVCSMARLPHVPMIENQLRALCAVPDLRARFAAEAELLADDSVSPVRKRAILWRVKTTLGTEFQNAPAAAVCVRYEDLVSAPDHWIGRMLEHARLPARGHQPYHRVLKGIGPGFTSRERPIDRASLARWSRRLDTADERLVWEECRELLLALRYCRTVQPARALRLESISRTLDAPILLVGRGGSGTRILSDLVRQLGVFLGNQTNATGDSVEWVDLIYEMAVKLVPNRGEARAFWREELRDRAATILGAGQWRAGCKWGFKLPESMLVLSELLEAFPAAQVIHLVRNPVDACLRRTHMTARVNNPIGKVVLDAAYRSLSWDRDPRADPDHLRNAASWRYQLDHVAKVLSARALRHLQVDYDDLCENPDTVALRVSHFLGCVNTSVHLSVEPERRRRWKPGDPRAPEIWSICGDTARQFGYVQPPAS